jgi:hypothetical protein
MVSAMSRYFIIVVSILWASMVFISWDGVAETATAQTLQDVEITIH